MKKTMPIVATILILFGCDWKNQPETNKASSSPTPSVLSSVKPTIAPTILPEPTVTPSFDGTGLDVYGKEIFCEKRENIKIKLDKPVSIAVTRDGSSVYVVNGKCGRKPYFSDFSDKLYENYCHYEPQYTGYSYYSEIRHKSFFKYELNPKKNESSFEFDIYSDIVENNPIYKITQNQKISLLSGDGSESIYCSNDGVLTTDIFDTLYFSANRKIYTINSSNGMKKFADLDALEENNHITSNNTTIRKIIVKDDNVFFSTGKELQPERIYPTPAPFEEELQASAPSVNLKSEVKRIIPLIGMIKSNNVVKYISTFYQYKYNPLFFDLKNDYLISNAFLSLNDAYSGPFPLSHNLSGIKYLESDLDKSLKRETIVSYTSWEEHVYGKQIFIDHNLSYIYTNFGDIKTNSKGEIFLNEIEKNRIWKIDTNNKITLFVGNFDGISGYMDGKGTDSLFKYPTGMTFDGQDNLYVADTGNNAIRKITPDGVVSTFYVEKGGI